MAFDNPTAPDEEGLPDLPDEEILDRVISGEMGDSIAGFMRIARREQEARYRARHPEEGLRERKRRLTRQLISDAATTMFATRGFDNVRVSEVAERVGVSEKTVYNYFPTKEAMVLDDADEAVEALADALRNRRPEETITGAVARAIKAEGERFDEAPDELIAFVPAFIDMVQGTPALRAAWLEMHDRLARVARDELAAQAGVDPEDPEPTAAGRALAGLSEVALQSRLRHVRAGLRGEALRAAVDHDIDRATRLLETGLWSFSLLALGARAKRQAHDVSEAAEISRAQVVAAMEQARAAFKQVSRHGREVMRQAQADAREAHRQAHRRRHWPPER